jgi:hypothetical protein
MAISCIGVEAPSWRFRTPVLRKSNAVDAMNSEYVGGQKCESDLLLLRATEKIRKNNARIT